MKSHDNKGKAKQKRQDTSGDSSGTSSEESDSPPRKQSTHGGRRTGAGNYQEQDIKALLKYTQNLENKFKNVCHPWHICSLFSPIQ